MGLGGRVRLVHGEHDRRRRDVLVWSHIHRVRKVLRGGQEQNGLDRIAVYGRTPAVRTHSQLPDRPVRMPEGNRHRCDNRVHRVRHICVCRLAVHAVHHVRAHIRVRAVAVLRGSRRHRRLLF